MILPKRLTIAIDGPAGSGKGTIGFLLAERLGYFFVDTGAMYRALAWAALQAGISVGQEKELTKLAEQADINFMKTSGGDQQVYRVLINGRDVTDKIRSPEIDRNSSAISRYPGVRQAMVDLQRKLAEEGGIVMEGRDIGTVVLPNADIKFFVTASVEERARRRYTQRIKRGYNANYHDLIDELDKRDKDDSERVVGPLRMAKDAIVIDTTAMSVEQTIDKLLEIICSRFPTVCM